METLFRNTTPRKYEDFDPPFDWHVDEGSHTLVVDVEGFTKEQIDLWLDMSENLNITGERPLYNNRWRRIKKVIRIPENCDIGGMGASLEDGVLKVLMPKLKVPIDRPDEISKSRPGEEPSTSQKPKSEPKSQMGHDDMSKKAESETGDLTGNKIVPGKKVEKERADGHAKKVTEDQEIIVMEEKAEELERVRKGTEKDEMARNSVDWEERQGETMEKVDGHQRVKPEELATNLVVAALMILGFGLFISYKMGS